MVYYTGICFPLGTDDSRRIFGVVLSELNVPSANENERLIRFHNHSLRLTLHFCTNFSLSDIPPLWCAVSSAQSKFVSSCICPDHKAWLISFFNSQRLYPTRWGWAWNCACSYVWLSAGPYSMMVKLQLGGFKLKISQRPGRKLKQESWYTLGHTNISNECGELVNCRDYISP